MADASPTEHPRRGRRATGSSCSRPAAARLEAILELIAGAQDTASGCCSTSSAATTPAPRCATRWSRRRRAGSRSGCCSTASAAPTPTRRFFKPLARRRRQALPVPPALRPPLSAAQSPETGRRRRRAGDHRRRQYPGQLPDRRRPAALARPVAAGRRASSAARPPAIFRRALSLDAPPRAPSLRQLRAHRRRAQPDRRPAAVEVQRAR